MRSYQLKELEYYLHYIITYTRNWRGIRKESRFKLSPQYISMLLWTSKTYAKIICFLWMIFEAMFVWVLIATGQTSSLGHTRLLWMKYSDLRKLTNNVLRRNEQGNVSKNISFNPFQYCDFHTSEAEITNTCNERTRF